MPIFIHMRDSVNKGFALVKNTKLLTGNHILEIQEILEKNKAGYRKLPGTDLKNQLTGEVVYTPPQRLDEIEILMKNLEAYINDDSLSDTDDLINNLFYHPYTKIEFIERDLRVSRLTAAKYLEELCKQGLLKKQKMGRTNYYINLGLFQVLAR